MIVVQPTDTEMAVNARRRGWMAVTQPFPGTRGVIDPPGLLDALRPIPVERAATAAWMRVSATEDEATFALYNYV